MDIKIDRQMMSDDRAAIEAQLHAKESFVTRIGLIPFAAGVLSVLAAVAVLSHF